MYFNNEPLSRTFSLSSSENKIDDRSIPPLSTMHNNFLFSNKFILCHIDDKEQMMMLVLFLITEYIPRIEMIKDGIKRNKRTKKISLVSPPSRPASGCCCCLRTLRVSFSESNPPVAAAGNITSSPTEWNTPQILNIHIQPFKKLKFKKAEREYNQNVNDVVVRRDSNCSYRIT